MTNSVYDPENKSEQRYHPDNPDPLDNRPAGDPSDPRTIHKNPAGEESKKDGAEPSENLRDAEESGDGLYNPEGDKRPASRQKLSATEHAGNLLADSASRGGGVAGVAATLGSRAKNFFWSTSGRKKKTAAGGIGAAMIGVGIFGMVSLSGAADLVQLSQILQRENTSLDNASSNRANKLLGTAAAQNIGETRVGLIQRQRLRGVLKNLNEIGIDFKTNSTGGLTGTTIDTNKLAHKYPELEGMSPGERRSWLVDKYSGVFQPDQFVYEGGNKFSVNVRDAPLRSVSLLRDKSLAFLDDHPIVGALNKRILGKFFDIVSLFHPIERAKSSALRSATHSLEDRINIVEDDQQKLDEPVESQADGAVDDVKSSANKYTSAVSNALLFTGGVCFVRAIADDIVTINRDRVALPSAIQATNFIAVGEQVKSGQDVSAEQINAINESLTNKQGQNVWQGRSLQVLEHSPHATGPDIPADYQQAFSVNTTANTIKSWADDVLGGSTVASAACSPIGLAAQAIASLALGAASIIGEIGSEGTLTPAIVAAWAAREGVGFATSAIGLHFVQQFILSNSATGKLAKGAFSGPLGGNLLAYGAREASNIGARSEGGIALAGSVSQALATQQEKQSEQQFRSESFFARVFNIYDYRSLTGKLAQSVRPGYTQNAASLISGFGNMGSSILSNLSSIFIPHSLAGSSYNWGFPKYGIPPQVLDDPNLASPIDNADKVAKYLDSGSGQSLIDKAQTCFGDKISKDSGVWDVEHTDTPNPNDQTYIDANCTDLSDYHWHRIIMFVFDTSTAQAMACYMGDDQSCAAVGYSSAVSSGPTGPPVIAGGLTNPFPDGWIPNRLDMGYDGTFKNRIVAPFDGTVTYAASSFSNWGGYIEIKADNKPAGLPTSTLYFAEGVAPIPGQQGQHVTAGTKIATPANSPFGDPYGHGSSGAIEWGPAQEGVNGSPTNTYVYGQCGSSAAKQAILNFSQWAQQLGLAAPSETSNAGCP